MFITALAEAAETAETTTTAGFSFGLSTVISIILVGYFALIGLASLVTGRVYGLGKGINNYTDESLAKFARPYGCSLLVVAVGIGVMDLYLDGILANKTLAIVGGVVTVIGLALMGLCYKKFLVKKDQK